MRFDGVKHDTPQLAKALKLALSLALPSLPPLTNTRDMLRTKTGVIFASTSRTDHTDAGTLPALQ